MRDLGADLSPDLQTVLDALEDPDCRSIVKQVTDPMTASEISEATEIPLSTTYRKLELLTDASILTERTEIRQGGHHTTRYVPDFEAVEISLSPDREFEVTISRPTRSADEQLSEIWSELRKETKQ
mgnify:CR=1 FL=1